MKSMKPEPTKKALGLLRRSSSDKSRGGGRGSAAMLMFRKSYCGFSERAQKELEKHFGGIPLFVINVDQEPQFAPAFEQIKEATGVQTVPQTFLLAASGENFFLGDSEQIHAIVEQGKK